MFFELSPDRFVCEDPELFWMGALKGQGPQHPNLRQVHELLYSSPEIDRTVGNLKIVEKTSVLSTVLYFKNMETFFWGSLQPHLLFMLTRIDSGSSLQ